MMMAAAFTATAASAQGTDTAPGADYFSLSPIEIFLAVNEQHFRLLTVEITIVLQTSGDRSSVDLVKNKIATNLKKDMQIYRFEQLQGQAGVQLFKEASLASVRRTMAPVVIPEVLVKRFLLH